MTSLYIIRTMAITCQMYFHDPSSERINGATDAPDVPSIDRQWLFTNTRNRIKSFTTHIPTVVRYSTTLQSRYNEFLQQLLLIRVPNSPRLLGDSEQYTMNQHPCSGSSKLWQRGNF